MLSASEYKACANSYRLQGAIIEKKVIRTFVQWKIFVGVIALGICRVSAD